MSLGSLVSTVLGKVPSDSRFLTVDRLADYSAATVERRDYSQVGYTVSFAKTSAVKLFGDRVSLRLGGRLLGKLNDAVDVGFVVYVGEGYVVGLDAFTFGGELWPPVVRNFHLSDADEATT